MCNKLLLQIIGLYFHLIAIPKKSPQVTVHQEYKLHLTIPVGSKTYF